MPVIVYKNKTYSFEEFAKQSFTPVDKQPVAISRIINEWYGGKNSFELSTSGSTGTPRKIMFSRRQMEESAAQTIGFFDLKKNDYLLLCLSVSHVAGFMMVIRSLVFDLNLIITDVSSHPLEYLDPQYQADFAAMVPVQLISLIQTKAGSENINYLDQMKALIIGGGKIPDTLVSLKDRVKVPVYETFGMTETLSHLAVRRINGNRPDKYFAPLPEVKISTTANGCLVVSSPVTLNLELVTNDLVKINPDQTFEWLGRTDNVVNRGGFKIQIEMLEAKIEKILKLRNTNLRFFLSKTTDAKSGEALELIIEKSDELNMSPADIEKLLEKHLDKSELPRQIKVTATFEYTALGKIDKINTLRKIENLYLPD